MSKCLTAKSKQLMRIEHKTIQFIPGSGEEALDCEEGKKYDTFSSCITLDDASTFEAAEVDAFFFLLTHGTMILTQKLARSWCKQMFRSSCLPLSDRRQQLSELRERTEFYACGRKGHGAHDYECAVCSRSVCFQTSRHALLV